MQGRCLTGNTSPRSGLAQTATSWPLNSRSSPCMRPVRRARTQNHSVVLEIAADSVARFSGMPAPLFLGPSDRGRTVCWASTVPTRVQERTGLTRDVQDLFVTRYHSATHGRMPRTTMLGNGVVSRLFRIEHDRCATSERYVVATISVRRSSRHFGSTRCDTSDHSRITGPEPG